MEELRRVNPWNLESECPRKGCGPNEGRKTLAKEAEKESLRNVVGEGLYREKDDTTKGRRKVERISKAFCTSEGENYVLECVPCREKYTRWIYYGENFRSCYQRSMEHQNENEEGIIFI